MKPVLIVGQGIAGASLAAYLWRANVPFLAVDHALPDTCSKVAAGLINPIAFRRLLVGWRAEEFLQEAAYFYRQLGELLRQNIFTPLPLVKIINDPALLEQWQHKAAQPDFQPFLSDETFTFQRVSGKAVLQAGFVDTVAWLSAWQSFFAGARTMAYC